MEVKKKQIGSQGPFGVLVFVLLQVCYSGITMRLKEPSPLKMFCQNKIKIDFDKLVCYNRI